MDVTPQMIEEVEFSEKFRGWDPEEVNDFLVRAGATIADLANRLHDTTARLEAAEGKLASGGARSLHSEEDDAREATRTLMMAQRTADATVADAREEAEQLLVEAKVSAKSVVDEARREADRLVGEGRVKADEMIRNASLTAEQEYGARRDVILQEMGELESRKHREGSDLRLIEDRVANYRQNLAQLHSDLSNLLDDPESLRVMEPLAVNFGPAPQVVEAKASEARAGETARTAPVQEEPVEVAEVEEFEEVEVAPAAFLGEDELGDTFDARGWDAADDYAVPDTALYEPDPASIPEVDMPLPPVGSESVFHTPAPTTRSGMDFSSLPYTDEVDDAASAAVAPGDPWVPGSWSELGVDEGAVPSIPNTSTFDETAGSAYLSVEDAFAPTGSTPAAERYLRDLDEAVNSSDTASDDAMAAFFESDDDPHTRRFGRRR